MAIQRWSQTVIGVELADDRRFSDSVVALIEEIKAHPGVDVLLDFSTVRYVNSSDITSLLRLRKMVVEANHRRLALCAVSPDVHGVFRISGLAGNFDFEPDVRTALAALQIESQ